MLVPRIVEIRQGLLKKNDEVAAELRAEFRRAGVFVVNLVSSPGAGKTRLLEWTLGALRHAGLPAAALVGDLETDNDAVRLARSGQPARQIQTHGICHLEADMVGRHLDGWNLDDFAFLFIENVGNLVCTSSYDLGEGLRVVLLCATEGEDKPLKYPKIFNSADAALLTKLDLAEVCEFDEAAARANIQAVAPIATVMATSARTGQGLEAWLSYLLDRRAEHLTALESATDAVAATSGARPVV